MVRIPLKENLKAKQLKVNITLDSISIKKKDNSEVILEGEWPEKIDLDDTTWTLTTE